MELPNSIGCLIRRKLAAEPAGSIIVPLDLELRREYEGYGVKPASCFTSLSRVPRRSLAFSERL